MASDHCLIPIVSNSEKWGPAPVYLVLRPNQSMVGGDKGLDKYRLAQILK